MKRLFTMLIVFVLLFSITGCSKSSDKTLLDIIKVSPAAMLELPDGSSIYVDSEIDFIRSFAYLDLMESPMEPTDNENDWLYRIVFNPSEKVINADEIIVSFHEKYVQIDSEYYITSSGVEFESILQWVESKFDYFIN